VRNLIIVSLVAVGCGGTEEPPSVTFVSPVAGATFSRDALAGNGALVASIPIQVEVGGTPAKVVLTRGDIEVGTAPLNGEDIAISAEVRSAGPVTLTATALDEAGAVLATTTVEVAVTDPQAETCLDWLDLYQLDYTVGPDNKGIADPVTVKTPVNGVGYRYNGSEEPRKTVYGDCTLLKSLAEAAPILRDHDIVEFVDIGIYNYRCIDQSKTPPNCTLSQHASATAIDIASFMTSDGTKYSVLTDWLIDPATTTCTATTDGEKDTFLHEVICALKAADIWNIVLTPNYNAAHRNHFHVDLTPGADTIKREVPTLDHRLVLDSGSASSLLVD
jgi:Extensin-like protein C-terminus